MPEGVEHHHNKCPSPTCNWVTCMYCSVSDFRDAYNIWLFAFVGAGAKESAFLRCRSNKLEYSNL